MRKILYLATFLLLLFSYAAAAADPTIEALETLRRGMAGTNDFTADIVQEKNLAMMKKKMVSKGVVRFKKPDTFFMELYPPHGNRLLLKDNVMAIRLTDQGTTDRVVLPPEEGLKKWLTFLAKPVTSLPQGMDVKGERHGKLWTLQIFPKGKGSVSALTLNFDSEGKINKIVIDERNKDRTTITLTKMRRNVGLTAADFKIEGA